VGDGLGAFTLTFDLSRAFLNNVFEVGGTQVNLNFLMNAIVVAEVNGGAAPLMGTTTGNSNQPLEAGSGVFLTVVDQPTQVDPNHQLTELPQSLTWTDEWSSVWVEVWGNTADAAGIYGGYVDLAYNSAVYTATEFPTSVAAQTRYTLRVTGMAFDGEGWHRIDHRLDYRKLDLARGDSGPPVRELQERLTAQGYWLGRADGAYGGLTHQAVMAFQKHEGLDRDGVAGPDTQAQLDADPQRPTARSSEGTVIEVDLQRQLMLIVDTVVERLAARGFDADLTRMAFSGLIDRYEDGWSFRRKVHFIEKPMKLEDLIDDDDSGRR
jgi:hypothetical protein